MQGGAKVVADTDPAIEVGIADLLAGPIMCRQDWAIITPSR